MWHVSAGAKLVIMKKNPDAEKNNPCLREQERSFQCFNDNDYNKEACQREIDNYNICKSFWVTQILSGICSVLIKCHLQNSVKSDRRRKGIKPYLPPIEERHQIKKEFFQKFLEQNSEINK